jgi:hypothetical protein
VDRTSVFTASFIDNTIFIDPIEFTVTIFKTKAVPLHAMEALEWRGV